tara:strand:+ start:4189 stop:5475 length:1287 start_codon:yes stop_codon:yes gene_type:complete
LNIFLNKKILIYGLGKSGLAAFKFLKKKNHVFLFDDFQIKFRDQDIKKKLIIKKEIKKLDFDKIIISPGININNCKLSKFLLDNKDKIYSDLDVFFSFYKNNCITITGTNGKSTTCQLLYEVLLKHKFDVRLVGNIGFPILASKKIKKKTIFVIEASSYQLEYSKIFKSKYAVILNIYPDHIERHKNINNYINSKFKLLKNQSFGHFSFIKKNDPLIRRGLKKNKLRSKLIKVDTDRKNNYLSNIKNKYFNIETNRENLCFLLQISKKLKLKNNLILDVLKNFRGLNYRQQIIYNKKNLIIINDSKSTSFSSSIEVLKANHNILWLLGGIPKKGDKFNLSKKRQNKIKAFIYGKYKKFFNKKLKGKVSYENFKKLEDALKKIFSLIKKKKKIQQTLLFSPCAASFDDFKNFEDRGLYFNKLIKKHLWK